MLDPKTFTDKAILRINHAFNNSKIPLQAKAHCMEEMTTMPDPGINFDRNYSYI